MDLVIGVSTDVGLRRRVNEDSVLAEFPVFAVADGMGGHDAGDLASQSVVAALRTLVGDAALTPEDVAGALRSAHDTVRTLAEHSRRGAGSTVTGAVLIQQDGRPHWLVFNIGDSRVYRWRSGELEQLTVDHSVVQQLLDEGQLAPEDVASYGARNVITRAVGADESEADFWLYPVVSGDRLLICSDGLTGEVADEELGRLLDASMHPQEVADALVRRALEEGGRDNVTVLVVEVRAGGVPAELDEETSLTPANADGVDESTVELRGKR